MPFKASILRPKGWVPYKDQRPPPNERGYGYPWRKMRNAYLAQHPYCEAPGCNAAGFAVDHKIPRARGGSDDPSNFQSLCRHHHAVKTAKHDHRWGPR